MRELELSLSIIKPLHTLGIEYMITGSIAAVIYGEPRLTHDIDIVIDLQPESIEPFHEIYEDREFYVPPVEVLKIEVGRSLRGHFNILDKNSGFKADIYMKGKDKLHKWAFGQRNKRKIDNQEVFIAPAEYVILRKLMYYEEGGSQKHLDDIRNILNHREEIINLKQIEKKVADYRLQDFWNMI